ncbi:hypothetical protein BU26DRAFT_523811, partial [Trematosphaeria pertusa]
MPKPSVILVLLLPAQFDFRAATSRPCGSLVLGGMFNNTQTKACGLPVKRIETVTVDLVVLGFPRDIGGLYTSTETLHNGFC